jgi:hypothetical protein
MNTESDSFYISALNIICIGVHHTILQILYSLDDGTAKSQNK